MSRHSDTSADTNGNSQNKVVEFPEKPSQSQEAARWLAKLDADKPAREDIEAFKHWVNEDEAHRAEFESLAAFWDDLNILTQVVTPRENAVQKKLGHGRDHDRAWFKSRYAVSGLVLSSLLAIAVLIGLQLKPTPPLVYTTAVGEQKTVELPDQTSVLLNTNSHLEVHYDRQHRRVHLVRGEAHFDVAHNPQKPFEVYAGKRLVRALGTAFTVYLRKSDVEVVVTEGVVEIDTSDLQTSGPAAVTRDPPRSRGPAAEPATPPTPQAGVPFTPEVPSLTAPVQVAAGNAATYDRDALDPVQTATVEKLEEKLSWQQGLLVFKGEPLAKVVEEISRYTAIKIVIPHREVKELKVGGIFKIGDTESMFEALRDGFGIHAEHVSKDFVYLVFSDKR